MKTKTIFCTLILMILISGISFSQSWNYDTLHVLLSSPDIDYRNPQFDKNQTSVNYFIKDCIFAYEKWNSDSVSNVAVRFMKYNFLSPEVEITNDNHLNCNVTVAYYTIQSTSENSKGAVVFQSNRNGNWDIFFSEYDQVSWSSPKAVAVSNEDETSPSIVSYFANNTVNYLISYQKGNDVFMKNYFNGVWMDEVNVTQADSLTCITPKLNFYFSGYIFLAYLRKLNDSTNSISYHRNQISAAGDITIGQRKSIYQEKSQDNIRFSNGLNYVILNYDYDTLGRKNFYSSILKFETYTIGSQTNSFSGDNFGGTGSSHGDITDNILGGYSLYSWINKENDSTQIVISRQPDPFDNSLRKFYAGNINAETYVNISTKLVFGNLFRFRVLWEIDINGRTAFMESFRDDNLTSVSNSSSIAPENYSLSQNYPNPFNPETIIIYQLSMFNYVTLKVYDVLGNEVATLVNEKQSAGSYSIDFDGSGFASGVYFYKLEAGKFSETKRMVLLK